MSESIVERAAKAIYDAAKAEDYVSDYRFWADSTTLDGQFNLDSFAHAAIGVVGAEVERLWAEAAASYQHDGDCSDLSDFAAKVRALFRDSA